MAASNWGVPDWRNEAAYQNLLFTDDEWRWERVRRRQDYRAAWQFQGGEDYKVYLAKFEPSTVLPDPRKPFPPRLRWARPTGIVGLEAASFAFTFYLTRPFEEQIEEARRAFKAQEAEYFDLDMLAKAPRDPVNRHHVKKWATYLRVLDARAVKAKDREIGEIIYGKEYPDAGPMGAGAVKTAEAWRDGDEI